MTHKSIGFSGNATSTKHVLLQCIHIAVQNVPSVF